MTSTSSGHRWAFMRTSGFDQVKLTSGADLASLRQLDQKLWAALACPTTGLEFDDATLAFIDQDIDGRIRAPELLDAIDWVVARIKSPDSLVSAVDEMPLSAINGSADEGKKLLASAKQILSNLGKADAKSISTADTSDTAAVFAQTNFNGDGIIPPEATEDEALQAVITDMLSTREAQIDRSGKPGIDQAGLDGFYEDAAAYNEWFTQGENDDTVTPLGDGTGAAYEALKALKTKVADYFARCQLAAYDERAIDALNAVEQDYLAVAAQDLSITPDEVADMPLARVGAGNTLPLVNGINPAWAAVVGTFRDAVVTPMLGEKDELTEDEWGDVIGRLDAFSSWADAKAGASVEALGIERLREILAGDHKAAVEELLAKDLELKDEADSIDEVNRLVHLHRGLFELANNFVNFSAFYRPDQKSIFQVGTLFMDQRSCDLVVRVADAGKHAAMAPLSRAYLAYCTCTRKGSTATMNIVAAFTDGDTDNLMVGRNGLFYDREGNDWDATITKIVDNPISIRQAFWSPYKKVVTWIEAQVQKRAAAAEKESEAGLTASAQGAAGAAKDGKAPPPPVKTKMDVGMIAALGVAVGGIVAALGAILQVFFGLGIWMPLGFFGLIFLISGPSMVLAWLKLRQRNLGPILDANGWAVNAMARINVPFGKSLTNVPKLPAGSSRDLKDPYAVDNTSRNIKIALLVLVALGLLWVFGKLDFVLPNAVDRATLLGPMEPVATEPADAAPAAPAAPVAPQ